jgi:hypothetical protein
MRVAPTYPIYFKLVYLIDLSDYQLCNMYYDPWNLLNNSKDTTDNKNMFFLFCKAVFEKKQRCAQTDTYSWVSSLVYELKKHTTFRKLALFLSSGESIKPNLFGPLDKANLNPRTKNMCQFNDTHSYLD